MSVLRNWLHETCKDDVSLCVAMGARVGSSVNLRRTCCMHFTSSSYPWLSVMSLLIAFSLSSFDHFETYGH